VALIPGTRCRACNALPAYPESYPERAGYRNPRGIGAGSVVRHLCLGSSGSSSMSASSGSGLTMQVSSSRTSSTRSAGTRSDHLARGEPRVVPRLLLGGAEELEPAHADRAVGADGDGHRSVAADRRQAAQLLLDSVPDLGRYMILGDPPLPQTINANVAPFSLWRPMNPSLHYDAGLSARSSRDGGLSSSRYLAAKAQHTAICAGGQVRQLLQPVESPNPVPSRL